MILDRNHRPDLYNRIISNKINNEEEKNASAIFNFSNKEQKEVSSKISRYNYIEITENDLKERDYLSSFFISNFTKMSAYFFGLMFGMNLILIFIIRRQLDHVFPYKAKEEHIIKLKKIYQMKRILFYSLLVYEIGFGLLAIKNYHQYRMMIMQTLPKFESDLIVSNKLNLEKYEKLFSIHRDY